MGLTQEQVAEKTGIP
nr:hypothetical protein [Pseudomonas aeruginosa]